MYKDLAMFDSEEHNQLRATTRRIIDEHINPYCAEWEKAGMFPAHQVFRRLGDAGLLGITKPEAFGGLGLDYTFEVAFAEELGHIKSGGVSMAIGVQTDMCTPALAAHGSDELRAEWLAPSITGELVGCIGVTEEGSGSDVANVRAFARRDGDDYVITGNKKYITNGMQADWMCMLCNTDDANGPHRNKTLIVVPLAAKGVERQGPMKKLGMHASDTAQIFFDEVRVPQRNRIGEENKGFFYQMEQFQEERLLAGAKYICFLEDIIEETIEYARARKAFGKSILDNQAVRFKLAEMQTEVETLRSLLYRTVHEYSRGEDVTKLASMVKLKVGQMTQTIPSACLQYWGGAGFMAENRVSQVYRDSRLASIGGGASEIMLEVICKRMGIHPS
jgi:citronellyl-CoA dehydrogenase